MTRARRFTLLRLSVSTVLACGAVQSDPALAADSGHGFLDADANTGFYAEAALGQADVSVDTGAFALRPPLYAKSNPLGLELAAGYRPLPAWSGELGYVRLGRAAGGTSDATIDGFMLSALGYLPTPLLNLYARAALMSARTYGVYDGAPALGAEHFHHRETTPAFGLGVTTNFRGPLNFRLESQGFDVTHAKASSLFSIGFVWSFP